MRAATRSVMKVLVAALAVSAVAGAAAAAAGAEPRTVEYVILSNGKPAGHELDRFSAHDHVDSEFEFNDRGRGPKIAAHYEFGADGLPSRIDISGVNYLKAPVDEHLLLVGHELKWSSAAEKGASTSRGYYFSMDGVSAVELAAFVRAASRAGKTLPLLPGGAAQYEVLAETTVTDHGASAHLREIGVTGLDFEPVTLWVDDDGTFFASPGTWFAVLRKGWEGVNEALFALQTKAQDERSARLAVQLSRRPAHALAIEHVQLFDSERAQMVADQTVVVQGNQIVAVGPAATTRVPIDAERVDGRGKSLLPGLFDMHMHVQSIDGILNIASGVTAGRDVGNDIARLAAIQEQWDRGSAIGPRLWKAGLIDGPGQYQAPTGIFVENVADAEAAVNRYADLGYVQIKLYSSLKPELVPGIIAVAHRRGLRVSGHVPNGMTAAEFVRDGADELQHINFIVLNFLAAKVKDTRTPERFTAVGEYAAALDLDSAAFREFTQLLLDHHTTLDVTLATFEGMFNARPGAVSPDFEPVQARLPVQIRRQGLSGGLPVTTDNDQRYRDSYAAMLRMTKRLFDAGIPILAGTDATAGIMLHRELELEVKAGIPPLRALQNATWLAATVLKQQALLGSVRVDKRADLLLVEGDPGQHISDIRRGRMVIKDGVVFDPARLYGAVGILPAP